MTAVPLLDLLQREHLAGMDGVVEAVNTEDNDIGPILVDFGYDTGIPHPLLPGRRWRARYSFRVEELARA